MNQEVEQRAVSTNKFLVKPKEIAPIPIMEREKGTRGTKTRRAKIITPNKDELELSLNAPIKEKQVAVQHRGKVVMVELT